MDLALETRSLRKVFGPLAAVDGIDLAVPTGSFYGFLGPNGAGKSTTIKCLTGLLERTSGEIRILGIDPLYVANEGVLVAFVAPGAADACLAALRAHPLGRDSRVVGRAVVDHPRLVVLRTALGGSRVVDLLPGTSFRGSDELQGKFPSSGWEVWRSGLRER